jgi:hypothetical protein
LVSAFVGSNWNNTSNGGPFYWNLNNDLGNANINQGARHSMNKITPRFKSAALAEK